MAQSPKSLSDIWLELKVVTMDAELSEENRARLELLLDSLNTHATNNQDRERKVLLKWFSARLGSRLFTNHYRQLFLELGNLMCTLWTGTPRFHTPEELTAWMNDELNEETEKQERPRERA